MLDFNRIDLLSSYNIAKDNMCYYKYYMFKRFVFFVLLNLLITNPSKALEITNIEWNILKYIEVTVYEPNAKAYDSVSCTAFYKPENNKPIGGSDGLYKAGIAQVNINLPGSYEKKNLSDFKIICK